VLDDFFFSFSNKGNPFFDYFKKELEWSFDYKVKDENKEIEPGDLR
jgi:hypothetical protein